MVRLLYVIFVLSGAAGLIYESIWTRYLGLFVGHSAYAQILVLVIFLGGMSLGALLVSRVSERLRNPLLGYALVELVAGAIGFVFHDGFQSITGWAYTSVFPGLAGSPMLGIAKWSLASALLLPQSVLLGATFPLMSAGVLRLDTARPGRTLSLLYFANSLGAAAGVLVAGFYLLSAVGLPGTLRVAAGLNVVVAAITVLVALRARRMASGGAATVDASVSPTPTTSSLPVSPGLYRALFLASFGTAIASFIYEIDWLRMLALVLGSATHAFELMLSAFILGLALGAFSVHARADRFRDPVAVLGLVQVLMGIFALATLLSYVASFQWIETLVWTFADTDSGYLGFTVARYGLCLAIMLPATFCAGMTLPLITRILVTSGAGERAIGAVYSWNTLGSIIGVMIGGLVLLPVFGLKTMLIVGAVLDMAIGTLLLSRTPRYGWIAGVTTALVAVAAIVTPRLDPVTLTSGVFRTGESKPTNREIRFYTDGRTSTVTGYLDSKLMVLSTNGKPDASLPQSWFQSCRDIGEPESLEGDAATQALVPLVTMAHAPEARTAAIIGHGSGMSSHMLLGSPALKELVTIEIEPQMIAGSHVFYPANRRAFADLRARYVIDDAKSYFASAQRQFDVIVSEPSNPWVSGVSGLFTTEFYARIRQYLTNDGVFGQWLQMYELDDELVLSVLAAIHQNFPSYEIYLVPKGDLLIVASNRPTLPAPDWSIVHASGIQNDLCRFTPLTPEAFEGLQLIGRRELSPLLDEYAHVNSDFYPILDLGAERRRFRDDYASGFAALSADWFNVLSSIRRQPASLGGEAVPAFPENPRLRARALATHLRAHAESPLARGSMSKTIERATDQWDTWQMRLATDRPPASWDLWLGVAGEIHRLRHGGAAGQADTAFHVAAMRYAERHGAPAAVQDVLVFRHSIASWDFAAAASAADRLVSRLEKGRTWIDADELRDGVVVAKLAIGEVADARLMLDGLARRSRRDDNDVRNRLLEAYVAAAERAK